MDGFFLLPEWMLQTLFFSQVADRRHGLLQPNMVFQVFFQRTRGRRLFPRKPLKVNSRLCVPASPFFCPSRKRRQRTFPPPSTSPWRSNFRYGRLFSLVGGRHLSQEPNSPPRHEAVRLPPWKQATLERPFLFSRRCRLRPLPPDNDAGFASSLLVLPSLSFHPPPNCRFFRP